jgi:large subunit ribosomal protein L20
MTRVKRGVGALKRRKKVLSQVKGFRHGRGTKERQAKDALMHAGAYSFAHRKDKKADAKGLWNTKINAGLHGEKLSFSKLMGGLKKKNIAIDRKILADLAENNRRTFDTIVKEIA